MLYEHLVVLICKLCKIMPNNGDYVALLKEHTALQEKCLDLQDAYNALQEKYNKLLEQQTSQT